MGRINSFAFCTLNGFYKDHTNDIGWHVHGDEETRYSEDSLSHGNVLLFGRMTYEMMYSFWPTSMAQETMSVVARGMNDAEKLVVSRSLSSAEWSNTRVLSKNWLQEIRVIKKSKNITLLGSGTILTQLAEVDLIDEYSIMIDPVIISSGTSIFDKIKKTLNLTLMDSKIFKSGSLLLTYEPKR